MLVKITKDYPDKELRRDVTAGEELPVTPHRAVVLINAGVAEEAPAAEVPGAYEVMELKSILSQRDDEIAALKKEIAALNRTLKKAEV